LRGVVFLGDRELPLRDFPDLNPGPGMWSSPSRSPACAEATCTCTGRRGKVALRDLTDGEGVDCAIECAGSPEARIETIRCVRTWGQACFVGEGGTVTLAVSQHLLRRQVTLHASWTFSTVGQKERARFVARRKIPLGRPLTHRFTLEQGAEASRLFDTPITGKGVFLS